MKRPRLITLLILCTALSAGVALASWYDDYDAGLNAIKAGQWKTAVDRMTAAIAGNKNENNNARTYGAIFINYHPYYYRAVAYINLGQYQKAIDDLEKTSGPGALDRGSIDTLMAQAKKGAETPAVVVTETVKPPVTNTVAPPPVQPSIDNALRSRARAALDQAKAHLQSAQQRNATNTPAYLNAQDQYMKANSRWATAKSNDDLTQIIADADNIGLLADSAVVAVATTTQPPAVPLTTTHDKPSVVTQSVLGPVSRRLHQALENYFNGDFDEATQGFQSLSRELPHNGWIWAFLGASQYSQYAFEGGDSYKEAATTSFRKARTYGKWKNGLPDKYFSRRIRNAFKQLAG